MPVTISSEAQLVFFNKVFGATHPVTVKAKGLLSQGVAFEVSLYNVKATAKGKSVQVNLTYGTTALMKGTADTVVLSQNKKLIKDWIGGLYNSLDIKPVAQSAVVPPQSVVAPTTPGPYSWAKPVDAVIDLKEAKALGQKVHGTSTGSVYHTVAFTDHVKVAARLYKTGSISIRAEWTDNPVNDLKLLADAGLQMKPTYGSIHFDAQDVPLPRVIGAFLLGTGIEWTQVVTKAADLVIAEYK
jgi:hypothetical protein